MCDRRCRACFPNVTDRPDFRLANALAEGLSAVNHASLKLCPVDRPRMMHGDGWAASKKPCSRCEMPDSAVCPISAAQQITTKATSPSSTVLKPVGAGPVPHCYSEATECNGRCRSRGQAAGLRVNLLSTVYNVRSVPGLALEWGGQPEHDPQSCCLQASSPSCTSKT